MTLQTAVATIWGAASRRVSVQHVLSSRMGAIAKLHPIPVLCVFINDPVCR